MNTEHEDDWACVKAAYKIYFVYPKDVKYMLQQSEQWNMTFTKLINTQKKEAQGKLKKKRIIGGHLKR